MFGLFRRPSNDIVIDRLYLAIVAASRVPELYLGYGIPDTFEGRFEALTLHAVLVLRRLQACESPGPEMAQHLIDTIFRHFDRTLREMGVGDTVVPKRMKRLAEAFLGRSAAYETALRATDDGLADVLARNALGDTGDGSRLAAYARAGAARIDALPLQAFIDGKIAFPPPETVTV